MTTVMSSKGEACLARLPSQAAASKGETHLAPLPCDDPYPASLVSRAERELRRRARANAMRRSIFHRHTATT